MTRLLDGVITAVFSSLISMGELDVITYVWVVAILGIAGIGVITRWGNGRKGKRAVPTAVAEEFSQESAD